MGKLFAGATDTIQETIINDDAQDDIQDDIQDDTTDDSKDNSEPDTDEFDITEDDTDNDSTTEDDENSSDVDEGTQSTPETEVKFDKKQQEKVNEIVNSRLERQSKQIHKELERIAGTELSANGTSNEVHEAVRLWGFMKLNPEFSNIVQKALDEYVSRGNYKVASPDMSREQQLNVREAILDLKLNDKTFAKYEKEIMAWAEEQGIVPTDKNTLNLIYSAWKGENLKKEIAKSQLAEQRKSQTKAKTQKKAVLEGGRNHSKKPLDYRKMADRDILALEGLALFTED